MNPKHKRLLIVIVMIFVTLISYRLFSTPGQPMPVPKSEQAAIIPIPVENNVPAESNTPWDQRLNNVVQIYSKDKSGKILSTGTGWFVKGYHGLIMTDDHVVDPAATEYQINLKDGRTFIVSGSIWSSEKDDIAKIQIPSLDDLPGGFEVCKQAPQMAQTVWLIGHPLNMPWSVYKGIIASPTRSNIPALKKLGFTSDYIQLDIIMYPGNSGGPVITEDNCVIGMADFIYAQEFDDSGDLLQMSFATKNNKLIDALSSK